MVWKSCKLTLLIALTGSFCLAQSDRQFRGVWVATVANIDWPSRPDLPTSVQQQEFIDLLDRHHKNGMNAIILQIRPAADAFYLSSLEPWSQWLVTNSAIPDYDPLAFCIKEAHARGMELHAWFNPYRARFNYADSLLSHPESLEARHPEWLVTYGKNKYLNPGLPQAREHTIAVVLDVVKRYPIDGVHFDDYFYPYKIEGQVFPDSATYELYRSPVQSLEDWRRSNIDQLIQQLHDSLQRIKPHVSFGISPFGVWRNIDKDPEGSSTRAGQTCYDDLYADVRKWLKEGWIDYVAPQLYLPIAHERMAFETMIEWWCRNHFGKPVYIGHAAYRVNGTTDSKWRNPSELFNQYRLCQKCEAIQGNIYFSSKSFDSNPLGINDSLQTKIYSHRALPPVRNQKSVVKQSLKINMTIGEKKVVAASWPTSDTLNNAVPFILKIIMIRKNKGTIQTQLLNKNQVTLSKVKRNQLYQFQIEAIDKYLRVIATGITTPVRRRGKRLVFLTSLP
jgi:uncharacterized lipoprotein YddW (UPF0748 family)